MSQDSEEELRTIDNPDTAVNFMRKLRKTYRHVTVFYRAGWFDSPSDVLVYVDSGAVAKLTEHVYQLLVLAGVIDEPHVRTLLVQVHAFEPMQGP